MEKRILIADDNTVNRTILEKQLVTSGYKAVVCNDGKEALKELLKPDGPCIAILDWMMPEMDGLEVIKRVRQQVDRRYVYIVVLTAKSLKSDMVAALDAGADDFMIKPSDTLEITARIRVGERVTRMYSEITRLLDEKFQSDRQHQALTGIMTKRASENEKETAPAAVTTTNTLSMKARTAISKLPKYITSSFEQFAIMDMNPIPETPVEYLTPGSFVVYGNAQDVQNELWLDFWLEFDRGSATNVYKNVMGADPGTDEELLDFLGEIINLIQGFFKTEISERGNRAITALLPQRRMYEKVAEAPVSSKRGEFYFGNEECKVKLVVGETPAPTTVKTQNALAVMDVILEPFVNPAQPGVVLVPHSTAMNDMLLSRLVNLAWMKDPARVGKISVLQPSSMAKYVIEHEK